MIERKVIGMCSPIRMGFVRILVCLSALGYVIWQNPVRIFDLPLSAVVPVGILSVIPLSFLEFFWHAPWAVVLMYGILVVSLFLGLVGFWSTQMIVVGFGVLCFLMSVVRSVGCVSSDGVLTLYLLFFLIFLSPGEGASIDELIRKRKPDYLEGRSAKTYGWSVFLIRAVIALVFFQSACMKLANSGWSWINASSFKIKIAETAVQHHGFENTGFLHILSLPDWLLSCFLALVLWVQVSYPMVLFSWSVRRWYPLIGMPTLAIFSFLTSGYVYEPLFLQLIFYDWDRILGLESRSPFDRRNMKKRFLREAKSS